MLTSQSTKKMCSVSSIQGKSDKTRTQMIISPGKRTTESTQLGSYKMSRANSRHSTREETQSHKVSPESSGYRRKKTSALTCDVTGNLIAVEKISSGVAVHSSPLEPDDATRPKFPETKPK